MLPQQPAPIIEERHQEALEQQQQPQTQPNDRLLGQNPQEAQFAPGSLTQQKSDVSSEHTPRVSQASSNQSLHPDNTLKSKKSPPTSLHSSFNEGSDLDQILDEQSVGTVDQSEKERKRRWRLSRSRNADSVSSAGVTSPRLGLGQNDNGDVSNLSISSSGHRPRKSESSDRPYMPGEAQGSFDQGRESDSKGPIGWIRSKYREAKESAEQRRAKSPPPADRPGLGATSFPPRGKSLELRRDEPQHASLAAIADAPAVASATAAVAGSIVTTASTGAQPPQAATVTMVQPEPRSPVQQTHAQAQSPPPAQVQAQAPPALLTQIQTGPQAQVQSPVQSPIQSPVQNGPQSPVQPQPEPRAQATPQKPQAPQYPQKIISMLDVDTVPATTPVSSPVSAQAPAGVPTTTQPREQPQLELPKEPMLEEKPIQATEQAPMTSPVSSPIDQTRAEQQEIKPEPEAPKQEQ